MGHGSTTQFLLVMVIFLIIYFAFMLVIEIKKKLFTCISKKRSKKIKDED